MRGNTAAPLESRTFKVKNPNTVFYCPLCRTQRALKYTSKLSLRQYIQVIITSVVCMMAFWPMMGEKVFFWPMVVWGVMEGTNKTLFRKEIPCPHCGFDATWYKKDVRVAKRIVEQFWQARGQVAPDIEQVENVEGV